MSSQGDVAQPSRSDGPAGGLGSGGHATSGEATSQPVKPVGGPRRGFSGLAATVPALPSVLLMVVAFGWPVLTILLRSLNSEGQARWGGFTLDHYRDLVANQLLRQVSVQTVQLALISTIFTVLLAFPTAYLMSRSSRRLATILMALVTIPFWVSILVRLFAFTAILGRNGIINDGLGLLGVGPLSLLFNTQATIIGMVAYLLPFMILILYAAMTSVDNSLITAARTMGASGRQAFLHIYMPQVRPALISGCVLIFVLGLGFFLTPAILGGPRNLTLSVYMQQQITIFEWGNASAAGISLLLVSLIGYGIAVRIGGASILTPAGRPASRGAVAREPLTMGVSVVVCWLCTLVVLSVLVLPLAVVVPAAFGNTTQISFPPQGFTTHWFADVVRDPTWTSAFWKSARVGLGTAVLAVLSALGLARFGGRVTSGAARGVIQSAAFAPVIVPVILLAIGVYDVELRTKLVGTDIGLILAHAVLAFPFAFIVISNAMSRLDGSLEPAAWSMGASRLRAFWTVSAPNLTPAVVGAFVISFMTSWDEAVLALFQTGLQKTLPVTIYSLIKSGVSPAVGAVAVILITPIVIAVLVRLGLGLRRTPTAEPSAT